jgi:hypothetical protein
MDTDKLVKAIQIIVKEELKNIVPKLVKEGVKKEMTKLLKENKQLREALKPQKPQQPTFMDEPVMETTLRKQPQKELSNNPVLNEVLNQTQGFNSSQSSTEEYRTMNFNTNMAQGGVEGMRAQMAAKMGLPDVGMGSQPNGAGVSTGNPVVDKALNRDYSGLMKAIDKKKGPYRPGM